MNYPIDRKENLMAYKKCDKCGWENGVRSKACSECKTVFPAKTKREKDLKVKTESVDWRELKKNDRIKVIIGYGPWMEINGQRHYTGVPGGVYSVVQVLETGVRIYDKTGHCFLYMGPERPSITGGTMAPHKIKKVR